MTLQNIQTANIENAANIINDQGIPRDKIWSKDYVLVNEKEYPLKYITQLAFSSISTDKFSFQLEQIKKHLKNLGFQFKYYEGGYNFFTKDELEFYKSIVNKDYRKTNPDHQFYGQKLYPLIAKTQYWIEQVKPKGFKIKRDGHWLSGYTSRVKPYIWPRIYNGLDEDVYFNVEVNGHEHGGFIGYKLDGYFATKKALPSYKYDLVNEYRATNNIEWIRIPFDKMESYTWEKLIEETKEFLDKTIPHYNQLKELLSKDTKISRITWNNNGWVKPSGKTGKSINVDSFEYINGFGHEEWLFDGDKVLDGYKYGFLEPINKHYSTFAGKSFDILLYSRNGETKENFWVANLKDVEVISKPDAERILTHYKDNGWYDLMKADLLNLNLDANQLDEWVAEGAEKLFNIRFKAVQLSEIQKDLIPVTDDNEIPTARYELINVPTGVKTKIAAKTKSNFSFASGSTDPNLGAKGRRTQSNREIELEYKHNRLQSKFLKYLQDIYGESAVKRECTAYGGSRIDIVRETQTGYVFYEIKTYNSLKSSIREGIGQLLEYCLYPNVREAEAIVLVTHIAPSQELEEYIVHLKGFINIPLEVVHFDLDKEDIVKVI
ncbi:hypothetical protein D3C71_349020 [compost metagenome]